MSALRSGNCRAACLALAGLLVAAGALLPVRLPAQTVGSAEERFRAANELARSGDYPKALAGYAALAAAGGESASLYWNWAQAAVGARRSGRGALGAAAGARAGPGGSRRRARDRARARGAQPRPGRDRARATGSRRPRGPPLPPRPRRAGAPRAVARRPRGRALSPASVAVARSRRALAALGVLTAAVPIAGGFARPTAAVVRRGAPLFDAASPTAEATGSLREGEVVPVLDAAATGCGSRTTPARAAGPTSRTCAGSTGHRARSTEIRPHVEWGMVSAAGASADPVLHHSWVAGKELPGRAGTRVAVNPATQQAFARGEPARRRAGD